MKPGATDDALLYVDELGFELLEATDGIPQLRFVLWKDPMALAAEGHHAADAGFLTEPSAWTHRLNQFIQDALPPVRAALPGWIGVVASAHDGDTHGLVEAAGATFCAPHADLVDRVENKCAILDLLREADVPTAALGVTTLATWEDVEPWLARAGGRIVIQAEFGHSGQTTWFVSDREDFERHAAQLTSSPLLRISRFVPCESLTVDACATRHGTAVGPLLYEFSGIPALTPFEGGWCGNYLDATLFTLETRRLAFEYVRRIGDGLAALGYRGCFGVDLLRSRASGDLFVTEVNARFTGASPLSNFVTHASAGAPLLKFHFDEYRGAADGAAIEDFNARILDAELPESLTLLAIAAGAEHLDGTLTDVPPAGIWSVDGVRYARAGSRWRELAGASEALFAPLVVKGEAMCEDCKTLGYVVMRGLPRGPAGAPHPIAMRVAEALRGRFGWRGEAPT